MSADNEQDGIPGDHLMRMLYKDAAIIGRCDEFPDLLLVLFPQKQEENMLKARQAYAMRYNKKVEIRGPVNGFSGFWILRNVTYVPKKGDEFIGPTEEAQYLEEAIKRSGLIDLRAKTWDELSGIIARTTAQAQENDRQWGLN